MEHVDTEDDIDIGNWKYEGPKDFVLKLIDKFGRPSYIEKCPMTNEAYSVTFKDIDGFDMVRVVDSNTNKLHPYPAKMSKVVCIFLYQRVWLALLKWHRQQS